jgi:hypothetical protein
MKIKRQFGNFSIPTGGLTPSINYFQIPKNQMAKGYYANLI